MGSCLAEKFSGHGLDVKALSHEELDITDRENVKTVFTREKPDVVIHCAAYSNVDQAEHERERCFHVNIDGTATIADFCAENKIHMIYISSDYVFDGKKEGPYEITDAVHPLSVYGSSKAKGEQLVLSANPLNAVLRISWLFGDSGGNFVETMLRLAEREKKIRVVADQTGSPTYTEDLADLLMQMAERKCSGIFHATNEGTCTWAEFAKSIVSYTGKQVEIIPISSLEYGAEAARPKNSILSKASLDAAGLNRLPRWEDALRRCMSHRAQKANEHGEWGV